MLVTQIIQKIIQKFRKFNISFDLFEIWKISKKSTLCIKKSYTYRAKYSKWWKYCIFKFLKEIIDKRKFNNYDLSDIIKGDGSKLMPFIIFKGKHNSNLIKKLQNL